MIKEIYVEKGDEVQKGDPLLAYDTAELVSVSPQYPQLRLETDVYKRQ